MKIRMRRWLILGALTFGTVAWLYRSLRRSSSPSTDEFINERHMQAVLVRRHVDPEPIEAVREAVSGTIPENDPDPLLSPEGATTASLFLNRNPTHPELVWYVELPGGSTGNGRRTGRPRTSSRRAAA